MNIDKQIFCMEVLNRGKVATQSQSKFDCMVKRKNMNKPITQSIVKMNYVSTLEERFGGDLKTIVRA